MQRWIVAALRAASALVLFVLAVQAQSRAVPLLANGQGLSCQTCHTSFPGLTTYGMMTMMSNFQNLDWKRQHQALPFAVRMQIASYLSNKDNPGSTTTKTLSLFTAGFLGRNFTYYAEQPIVDTGQPGVTEQIWLSWNGLLHGTNSLQVGKYHTPFPFMPAHGWTLSDYLLATQDNGQNTFEPNASHWGVAFNGMSNDFMYNVAYLGGDQSIQHAFDYNRADSPRTMDLNVSYGGMTKPYTIGLVAMRGVTPLLDSDRYAGDDAFTRAGVYYGYQTPKFMLQTMYYRGYDSQPDLRLGPAPLAGYMFEFQRDIGWRDHVLARYDVASSDVLNRQYVVSYAHHFLPNMKATAEILMSPRNRPRIGFALDWGGPFNAGSRFLWKPPVGARVVAATGPASQPATAARAATTPQAADPNTGAKLVQNNGCTGCHGAQFQGALGPKLMGIEHQLGSAQIADFIKHPRAPMPNFGFGDAQIDDIVAYLSNLDGGAGSGAPVVTIDPANPTDRATLTIRFADEPKNVVARSVMHMGAGMHHTDVSMHAASDPHVWQGDIHFTMGGPWNIEIDYDGQHLDVPVQVQ